MPWNVAEIKAQHRKWQALYDASMQRTMLDIGQSAVALARDNPALKRRTGAYAKGWHRMYRKRLDQIDVALVGRVPHEMYHEIGTGIYGPKKRRIYPRKAQFLSWVNPDTGKRVFARSVRGVKPTWHGQKSTFNAWVSGRTKLLRESERLAGKF